MKDFNWNDVIFSDECRFGLQSDGKISVWRKPGERYHCRCVVEKSNSRKSVMFWGSISIKGLCSLLECSDKMNANQYISVLDLDAIHTLPHFNQTFLQDNAPIHKAASVMAWLKDYDVDVVEWPPNSQI